MPTVTFMPSGRSASVPAGTELTDAAQAAGVLIEAACGGKGTCGACIVRVASGQVDSDSIGSLTRTAAAEGHVLACRSRVGERDVTIEVPEQLGYEGGKLTDADETHLLRRELLPREFQFEPLALKWLLAVEPPRRDDGLSDLDRLTRAVQRDWGRREVIYPLSVMRSAAAALRAAGGQVTVTLIRGPGRESPLHVIRVEAGDTTTRHFGLAIDVGTTTVAVQLINLTMGRILATRSDYNDQVACGLDVLSRITYARTPRRLEELRTRVLGTINRLIAGVCEGRSVAPAEICNAVVSGNTTMMHLLLGLEPEQIRLDPYTPTVTRFGFLTAAEIGMRINPDSWICLSPCVGSYVGGDITAGLLCTDLATDTGEINLFIDVGTNGELVIGNNEFLMTCACSAGPAFEGGGIECGMRAALGAVEKVDIDPATGVAKYWTIGQVRPRGICGSGMIDLLAKLLTTGWLDPAGRLDRSRPSPAIQIEGRRARYVVAPAEQSHDGRPVTISELDIENIVRAKAAIYSACGLMLGQVGIGFGDLAHIYIAGGFGRFLDLENAVTLGLLPDLPRERFAYVGNTSLMGSYMVAVSQDYRRRQLDLASRMTYVDLGGEPGYMEQYTAALFLPHTDPGQFPSVQARMAATQESRKGRPEDAPSSSMRAAESNEEAPFAPSPSQGEGRGEGSSAPGNREQALIDAARLAASKLQGVDLAARCATLGLEPPDADGAVVVPVFGRRVRLAPPDFEAVETEGEGAGEEPARLRLAAKRAADRVLALHYLLCDVPVGPTGELIGFRDLPGGPFYWDSFRARSAAVLERRIGNDLATLRKNLDRFGWQPLPIGDLGARVQAVGRIDVTLIYRVGDEEMGPSAEVVFDAAIRRAFDAEDAAVIAGRLCIGLL
ncbi:MAG: Na(+)-translocating NADH-quinone reductase subunit F [Phycisphaerae bacterium]|nr:Na(+)-translocating NADH-quinone reductase subunit F [Phycisphaerae bacterium]